MCCACTLTSDETAALAAVTCLLCNSEREAVPGWPLTSLPTTTVRASAYNWVTDSSMSPKAASAKSPALQHEIRLSCEATMSGGHEIMNISCFLRGNLEEL